MDVLDLLQQIEKQQLSRAKYKRDRSSLEKIYHTLEIIENSILALTHNINNNNNNSRRVGKVISFDELVQKLNDQIKQNAKDGKKELIRIPRISREALKDGNHPLLAEIDSTLKQMRQQQRQQFNQDIKTDDNDGNDNKSNNNDDANSIEVTIDRMIDDVSTALDDYDNNKIIFEIGGEQYNKLKKWQNSVDDRLFRYQLETGKLGPGSNTRLFESLLDELKLIAKQGGTAKPYYGACGGGYDYKFIPTSIGLITKVENVATKEEIDLTDYESL
ncbi:MAG TPA: hypothetical protein VHG34_03750 [Nitrososphaeraceae archaeon]|jgi:hypothetical protein|nr:hypothetical protein [Nitrososphaeraceae archaeon]